MGIEDVVSILLTKPPPSDAAVGETQEIKGTVKFAETIGALPFVYAEIQKKDWYKPDILEKTWHERGFPMPISGEFTIDWVPDKKAHYEVTVVATPAPLSLPLIGVFPIVGKTDTYKVEVSEAPPPPTEYFSLEKPTISPPSPVEPDTNIVISCPVTSHYLGTKTINAKCIIYEGSFFPGHGTKLAEYLSQATSIAPGETKAFEFPHTTVAGTIDRRDVEVEVYIAGARVKQGEWDDVYYVKAPEMETLEVEIDPVGAGYVTVSPAPAGGVEHNWEFLHGTVVTVTAHPYEPYKFKSWSGEMKDTTDITAPVYAMTEHRRVTAHFELEVETKTLKVIIDRSYMGWVSTDPPPLTITNPSGENHFRDNDAGEFERDTTVYVTAHPKPGYVFKSWSGEMTDTTNITAPVYAMTENRTITAHFELEEVELETLEVKINPVGAGYVTVSPAPEGGTQHNWQFPHGTTVYVTAHPNPGYVFRSWSGEMTDTTAITAPVYPMTEHRLITAHFELEEVELELLEVEIDPVGTGYVTTSPAPVGGVEYNWQFPHGTTVYVTAHPNPGYRFKSWSGEMTDTTAITAPVYPMTEHRRVTAHFEQEIGLETLEVRIYPVGAGSVTTSPEPVWGVEHNWQFPHGTTVYVTAHPNPGYRFKSWSGEMKDTTDITAPVYPMTEHRRVTAHFEEIVAPPAGISFGVRPWGVPPGWAGYDRWMCAYYDPGIGDFVGDQQWHRVDEYVTFSGVQTGGYFAAWVLRTSDPSKHSPQYTSGPFWSADGKKYLFNLENLVVYEVA